MTKIWGIWGKFEENIRMVFDLDKYRSDWTPYILKVTNVYRSSFQLKNGVFEMVFF